MAYEAFNKAFELDPGHVHGKLKPNFRVSMLKGMQHPGTDDDTALLYAELALKAYPEDREIILQAVSVFVQMDKHASIKELSKRVTDKTIKALIQGTCLLSEGKAPQAEKLFAELSRASPDDYRVDDGVAKVYRSLLEGMSYGAQMQSPFQKKVLHYYTRAVEKYFRAHPFRQKIELYPPLKDSFWIGQGAGGISFHYGLENHYSYDLMQPMGSPILASADGKVLYVMDAHPDNPVDAPVNLQAQGNYVVIQTGALQLQYGHIKQRSATVRPGQQVKAGAVIAALGNSGISRGPHLHFKIAVETGISLPPVFTGLLFRPRGTNAAFEPSHTLQMDREYKYDGGGH